MEQDRALIKEQKVTEEKSQKQYQELEIEG